ncbi:MAG TPA: DNA mismatch repair protein MutS, partial [Ramlibacter sp.]|nr:DNA mismatch repair protein MutS [Ramlibacter sp.]
MKARSLHDLAALKQQLADREQLARAEAARVAEARKRSEAERNLFQRAAGTVQPLRAHGRVRHLPQ